MPAVTLGFDEIEDRLRVLRRRVNLYIGQQIGYVALSVVAVSAGALIWAALRGSPAVFAVTFWLTGLTVLVTLIAAPLLLKRRIRSVAQTAALADERAHLQDRLATLLATRGQASPSRFAPYLLTQALALGRRWEPRAIAPQRVPKSLYVLLAALAFPTTTAVVLPPPPPAADVARTAKPTAATKEPITADLGASPRGLPSSPQKGAPSEDREGVARAVPGPASDPAGGIHAAPKWSDEGTSLPAPNQTSLPQQLQQMIRKAFHAEALPFDRNGLLPVRAGDRDEDASGDQAGSADADAQVAKTDAQRDAPHRQGAEGQPPGSQHSAAQAPQAGQQGQPGEPGEQANANQAADSAKGSGAGSGSAGAGLLAKKGATGEAVAGGEPKTFKLTLTSFLRGLPVKPPADPPRPRGRGADSDAGSPSREPGALSEHQLGDDFLRKSDIPRAYEEIVRRVYSARPPS